LSVLVVVIHLGFIVIVLGLIITVAPLFFLCNSDVNKDWTCKDKDKDKDKDFTYSYLLQVAAKLTIAIK